MRIYRGSRAVVNDLAGYFSAMEDQGQGGVGYRHAVGLCVWARNEQMPSRGHLLCKRQ